MADRRPSSSASGGLVVSGLHVYYGASHALQGVDLDLGSGVLSVVGRNGMGKSTLCKAIMGLVPVAQGTISYAGKSLANANPADISRHGVGYVPQGRRLWPSLTVDEHLRLVDTRDAGWNRDRIYTTFPRLAERRTNAGSQLSGGEQQMLAISRALLLNPRLLVMDEPTEGLAPVIVDQVVAMILDLADDGAMDVLLIEQNITVATSVAQDVAVMVNGRVSSTLPSSRLAGDRALQQSLLGVGRVSDSSVADVAHADTSDGTDPSPAVDRPARIYVSNPSLPTRWSRPASVRSIENASRTVASARPTSSSVPAAAKVQPLGASREGTVIVAGTLDTKGPELRFIRDTLKAAGVATTGGGSDVFSSDRGRAVTAMAEAFESWISQQSGVAGIISAAGSGGTAMVAPAMRTLPVGVPKVIPKVMISTIASGDVKQYVGSSDIVMMHSVADVQGLNSITRQILANGANAIAGMVSARKQAADDEPADDKPSVGLTMFGVTTPCVQQVQALLESDYECLVFHATGTGGEAMETLVESGLMSLVIDLTTTEVCDLLFDGQFPAHDDYEHNPEITLMRTNADECAQLGRWIGQKLNDMVGPVRFFLPEGGVSALSGPGEYFHDPAADHALFSALEQTVRQTHERRLIRSPHHINDPQFARQVVEVFTELHAPLSRRANRSRT